MIRSWLELFGLVLAILLEHVRLMRAAFNNGNDLERHLYMLKLPGLGSNAISHSLLAVIRFSASSFSWTHNGYVAGNHFSSLWLCISLLRAFHVPCAGLAQEASWLIMSVSKREGPSSSSSGRLCLATYLGSNFPIRRPETVPFCQLRHWRTQVGTILASHSNHLCRDGPPKALLSRTSDSIYGWAQSVWLYVLKGIIDTVACSERRRSIQTFGLFLVYERRSSF